GICCLSQRCADRFGEPDRGTESRVQTVRIEGLERAKLFSDNQRLVTGHHDPTGAQTNLGGRLGKRGEQQGWGRTCDARDRVMLCHPQTMVTQLLSVLGTGSDFSKHLRCCNDPAMWSS